MTVAEHASESPAERHPLRRGASPATIRARLLPEDAERFLAAYQAALVDARDALDLTPVFEVVEHWRQIAALQSDPVAFRRSVRAVAELTTGEASPEDEPLDVSRAKAGM